MNEITLKLILKVVFRILGILLFQSKLSKSEIKYYIDEIKNIEELINE